MVRNVKFHLNLQKVNQLDVKIALERTNQNEVLAVEMAATIENSVAETIDSAMIDQEKCIKQLALIAEKLVKYRSNLLATNQ